jgi:hypothetical protein
VGAQIWRRCLELGWLIRQRDTRALRLTAAGKAGLLDTFGVDFTHDGCGRSKPADVAATARLPLLRA